MKQISILTIRDLLIMRKYCIAAHDSGGHPIVSLCGKWDTQIQIRNCPYYKTCDCLMELDTLHLPMTWKKTKYELSRILKLYLIQKIES